MTMNVTVKNKGPEVYTTKVETVDTYEGKETVAKTEKLKMGEETDVVIHSSRKVVLTEELTK